MVARDTELAVLYLANIFGSACKKIKFLKIIISITFTLVLKELARYLVQPNFPYENNPTCSYNDGRPGGAVSVEMGSKLMYCSRVVAARASVQGR